MLTWHKTLFIILAIFAVVLSLATSAFSYLWVDHGLYSVIANSHPLFDGYKPVFTFAHENRVNLAHAYIIIILLMFLIQILLLFSNIKNIPTKYLFILAGVTTFILSVSYPFISHDFFAYIFYARMVVFHHLNPYVVSPEHLINVDYWITFVHNIHIVYPYGPLFLLYTMIPQIVLSSNRLVLNLFALKIMSGIIFFVAGLLLYKLLGRDKRIFSLWYFNPLLIIESLVNGHNDILMLTAFFMSIYLLSIKKHLAAWTMFIGSFLIKFITVGAIPLMVVSERWKATVSRVLGLGLVGYILTTSIAVHAWYFTWVYLFIPFMKLKKVSLLIVYIVGILLLINYFPFIKSRTWGEEVPIPNAKLWITFLISAVVLIEVSALYKYIKLLPFSKQK